MLRPWDLKIELERGPVPAWSQIADALIEAIRRGRLAPGTALPGTRVLADRLNVNRKTVGQAYEELIAQGWLTAEPTRGTFVSAMLPIVEPETITAKPLIGPALELRGNPPDLEVSFTGSDILRFDDGTPDTRLMPAELVARAYRRALLARARRNQLGYGDPRGTISLREAVAAMLRADRGLHCTADNICITRGSQMGIYLAAKMLAGLGDQVGIEALSYPPARAAFVAAGARIVRVGLDGQGMRVEELEALCREGHLRAIYITPHHQFPTTVVLPQQRRLQLLALADQFGFAIIEDDYDHEFHFGHRPMLPLASTHGFDRLIYIGSFSKLFSPSLRIGYLVAAEDVVARAAAEIMLIDRQGDPVTEAAAAELMVTGVLKSHTRKVLRIYAQRRETLAALLSTHLPDDVEFSLPLGGLAVWVNFAANIDVPAVAAAAIRLGLEFTPGQRFATNGTVTNGARLGFAGLDDQELKRAVDRLAEAVRTSPRRDGPR
jgi:GntR family transcriptional regulator/MocR family aminotransferase